MYRPSHFEQHDAAALHALIRRHPLAMLVVHDGQSLSADPVPLLLDLEPEHAGPGAPPGVLRGHVARANPLWQRADGGEVLAVFQGPQAYVSPGWYPSKAAHGKVVPTWNYTVVQARGILGAVHDGAWLHALVSRLTDLHEGARPKPWAVDDAPPPYVEAMLKGIVGIEIVLTELVGKWKVSQNRDAADREGVAHGLAELGAAGDAQAAAMARLVAGG